MPTFQIYTKYASITTATITLASLASDTNLLVGRESNAIDNSTLGYDDYLVSGQIRAGTGTLVANRSIEIWAVAELDDSNWPSPFGGTDAGRTISLQANKNNICGFVSSSLTTSTASDTYRFVGKSVAQAFGGILPRRFSLFVTQSTGQALSATAADHFIYLRGIYRQAITV